MTGLNVNLDDLLLDIATTIELSDNDRKVAENRYRKLKEHLERPSSPLKPYLVDGDNLLYPQGSMAIGTTIIAGDNDDRFDVDALVELNIPSNMSPKEALDLLYQTLKSFPGATEVERCTRCVQLKFPFMHMDVTIMSPYGEPRIERVGDIFHSPGKGEAYRVPANPYGFSKWFKERTLKGHIQSFEETVQGRRATFGMDRLYSLEEKAIEQEDLPAVLPPRIDSEQVVALKLLKRFIYLDYKKQNNTNVKRPPSIYITKLAADIENSPYGLCQQLESVVGHIRGEMDVNIKANTMPDERNPEYEKDKLNDRWPNNTKDMESLRDSMARLNQAINLVKTAESKNITGIFEDLFGERIAKHSLQEFNRERSITQVLSSVGKNIKIYLNPKHRKEPEWSSIHQGQVEIRSVTMEKDGFRARHLHSNDTAIPKRAKLFFEAVTDIPEPYQTYWQAVNTGDEAAQHQDLRGEFKLSHSPLKQKETTKYNGVHSMECFIVKDGFLAARSGQFLINVE